MELWHWLLACMISSGACGSLAGRYNYASFDCAARILATNSGAKSASSILFDGQRDSYLRNLCSFPEKWVVIELCQDIRIDTLVMANYEYFSGTFKDVEFWTAKKYPPQYEDGWRLLGRWRAENKRGDQVFRIPDPDKKAPFARFLKIKLTSHYGNEYYCPLSVVKVYGKTMIEDFEEAEEVKKKTRKEIKKMKEEVVVLVEDMPSPQLGKGERPSFETCPVTKTHSTLFGSTCPSLDGEFGQPLYELQPIYSSRNPAYPIVTLKRSRPVFPIPMKPVRKTVIYQLTCPYPNPLKHPVCSSQYRSVTVVQQEYLDPNRLVLSDLNEPCHGEEGVDEPSKHEKQDENIFKSLTDRIEVLERGQKRQSYLLQSAINRLEFQIDQILAEAEESGARGIESYRKRLQKFLINYVEDRIERIEEGFEKELHMKSDMSLNVLYLLTAVNLFLGLAIVLMILRFRRSPTILPSYVASPQISPPNSYAASTDRIMDQHQAFLDGSPLLLNESEANLVDGIYTTNKK